MKTLLNTAVVGNELALAWEGGREDFIPLEKLRRHCPCAVCQGEPDALGHVVKPSVTYTERSFVLLSIKPVGGYALQMKWGDGHGSGIYQFDLLQKL